MFRLKNILFFSLCSLSAYLISLSPLAVFSPQIIALFSIIFIVLSLRKKQLSIHLISFIITLIVLETGSLNSPVFFFIYFLLFVIAFQSPPTVTLGYSVALILILSGSLNSPTSLIPLLSLLFITPLAGFVSSQYLETKHLSDQIITDETEVLRWYSLKFKKFINQTLTSTDFLLQNHQLNSVQKAEIYKIRNHIKNVVDSSRELTQELEDQSYEKK